MANIKAIIGISSLLVLAMGGYYLYKTKPDMFKRAKKEDEPDPVKAPEKENKAPAPAPVIKNTRPVAQTKPAPVEAPPRIAPGFTPAVSGPQSTAVKTPAMGANLYVLTDGANAYKTAKASQTNIYKFYPKGTFVGTYLNKSGIFTGVIVEEKNMLGIGSNKTVYFRSSEIYQK